MVNENFSISWQVSQIENVFANTITSLYNSKCVKILNRKTKRLKFDRHIVMSREFADRNQKFSHLILNKVFFKWFF